MPDRQRILLLAIRQALIIALRAIEDYAEMPRSIEPKRKPEVSAQHRGERQWDFTMDNPPNHYWGP